MSLTLAAPPQGSLKLSLLPERHAPHAIRQALVGHPIVPGERLDAIQLLLTELVTNSVLHAGLRPNEPIEVLIDRSLDGLRIEVADRGPGFEPPPPPTDPLATSGRGLALVAHMSDRWGVVRDRLTRVWFEIDLS